MNVGEEKYWRIFWEILIKADGPRGCGRRGIWSPVAASGAESLADLLHKSNVSSAFMNPKRN